MTHDSDSTDRSFCVSWFVRNSEGEIRTCFGMVRNQTRDWVILTEPHRTGYRNEWAFSARKVNL